MHIALAQPDSKLDAYPEAAVTWLQGQGMLEDHLVAPDYVGNYLEARYGPRHMVFMDDRVDMYPVAVSNDYHDLLVGTGDPLAVLDRRGVDVVLWADKRPLVSLLRATGRWRELYHHDGWIVLQRA